MLEMGSSTSELRFGWCGKLCPIMYEHYHKQAEVGLIAEQMLHKIESRMKPSAQHPSNIGNYQHKELRRGLYSSNKKIVFKIIDINVTVAYFSHI